MLFFNLKRIEMRITALTVLCLLMAGTFFVAFADAPTIPEHAVPKPISTEATGSESVPEPVWEAEKPASKVTLAKKQFPVSVNVPARAKAAISVDAVTGQVFSSKKADVSLPVASVSKLMTIRLVLEKIDSGKGSLDSKVKIKSKNIETLSRHWQCGGYVLKRGQTYTVRELLYLALLPSSNAAATQLGIWVSGSNKAFVAKMNREAAALDLTGSSFTSASGLDNIDTRKFGLMVAGGQLGTNRMSARDVATLSQAILETHPEILGFTNKAAVKIKKKVIYNTNRFLTYDWYKKMAKGYKIDGLKTGYTSWAGSCFVSSCKPKGKHRLITVILNDPYKFDDNFTLIKNVYKKNSYLLAESSYTSK